MTEQATPAVETRRLVKRYRGGAEALRGVDLTVPRGQVFGLLGPNGAGKTTLVKSLLTLVRPTGGEARLLGRPVGDRSVLAEVGFLPEACRFPEYLNGRDILRVYAAMAGIRRADRNGRADRLMERVGLGDAGAKKVGHYSRGMRQRLGLAQSMMNEPKLLFLDEPTEGLDPVGRILVRDIIEGLRDGGVTVFLNSHQLGEVETTCDTIAILVAGRVRRFGTIDDLTAVREGCRIVCQTRPTPVAEELAGRQATVEDRAVVLDTADAERVNAVIDLLRAGGVKIISVQPERPSLEDVFVAEVRGGGPAARPAAKPRGGP